MQQDHQRREQPRHQADETIVMWKLTKAGAMLLADPIMVEHLEMLERREVKQHHDEQHLSARELAGALPCCLRRDQPVRFPVFEHSSATCTFPFTRAIFANSASAMASFIVGASSGIPSAISSGRRTMSPFSKRSRGYW